MPVRRSRHRPRAPRRLLSALGTHWYRVSAAAAMTARLDERKAEPAERVRHGRDSRRGLQGWPTRRRRARLPSSGFDFGVRTFFGLCIRAKRRKPTARHRHSTPEPRVEPLNRYWFSRSLHGVAGRDATHVMIPVERDLCWTPLAGATLSLICGLTQAIILHAAPPPT